MMRCSVHRLRYRRLWRLPSVRAIGAATIATVVAAGVSAAVAPLWTLVAVLVAATAVYVRRYRDRITVEVAMVRALVRSGAGCPGAVDIPGLTASVQAEALSNGVTRIDAASWLDAVRALGYLMGRDRGFQLDLLRRTASGRLAQVWGRTALPIDRRYRPLGLTQAAGRAATALEAPERDLLTAFAAGVNAAWRQHGAAFELRFLSYLPQRWTVEDSLLVALFLFHALSWNEPAKRAEAVIRRAFPEPIAAFLLGAKAGIPAGLAGWRDPGSAAGHGPGDAGSRGPGVVAVDGAVAGSNCWVSNPGGSNPGGSTTEGPGPMLACDLHLPLTMPNLLYEVDLRWAGERVRGLAAIGLPVVLTGSNGHLAWGVTNLSADVLDLVPVVTPTTTTTERIRVRGGPDTQLDVTFAGTMPVSPSPLLGEQVAIRWTGYDPRSLDLKFQRLAQATSVGESIKVLDEADGIALNVLVADDSGRMAHLATGLLPKAGPERPRLVDPPDGVLVSANDVAVVGDAGYDVDPGFRARRVRRLLAASASADPASMRAIQHDAAAELYLPYRDLAVAALSACRSGGEGSPLTAATERTTFVLTVAAGKTQPRPSRASRGYQIADLLAAWDGTADASSRAFPVLVRLREILAQRVLSGFLTRCREYDPSFVYPFRSLDGPLLAILHSGDPALLPAGEELNIFVARCLDDAVINPADLPTWGEVNAVGVGHPVAGLAPWSAALLGIAATPQSGALHSVRTCVPGFGAVGRAVLAAGYASFELPGGQSGHPLSKHYDDRHARWSSTDPPAERAPQPGCTFVLRPTSSGSGDR